MTEELAAALETFKNGSACACPNKGAVCSRCRAYWTLRDALRTRPDTLPVTDEGYVEAVARAIFWGHFAEGEDEAIVQRLWHDWAGDRKKSFKLARAALSVPRPDHLPGSMLNDCIREIGGHAFVAERDDDGLWAVRTLEAWEVLKRPDHLVRNEVLEEAAKVAERQYAHHGTALKTERARNYEHAGNRIAAAIRACKNGGNLPEKAGQHDVAASPGPDHNERLERPHG